ncbi:hypothetical protein B0T17DRAFT_640230 [Bombardia bombarda]|uniref:Protein kinase domain-containing protein n=1 Tax=Bombardia bombarda TaxID=252184 RepID=A0AA39X184_9PEZI|nr:hypothetical protein B0T17DRAFT_640230 [Bombardia bombarda]
MPKLSIAGIPKELGVDYPYLAYNLGSKVPTVVLKHGASQTGSMSAKEVVKGPGTYFKILALFDLRIYDQSEAYSRQAVTAVIGRQDESGEKEISTSSLKTPNLPRRAISLVRVSREARKHSANYSGDWGTPTDIWSFGNAILSLLYGGGFHLFNPANEGIKSDHDEYELVVLHRMYRYFGPFPPTWQEIADDNAMTASDYTESFGPPTKPFHLITRREIPLADKDFILKIMKLDPRDRPTAEQSLADPWFTEESEDTRDPL